MQKYHSNGKLLLTGEYVVLDGAISLAVPTKYGQSLQVKTIDEPKIKWKSINENGHTWFKGEFEMDNGMLKQVQHDDISNRLIQIFRAIEQLNPGFFDVKKGYQIVTSLDFPTNWGLGTSSTLINNVAQWANVDAFKLLELTFGGSGYDIACAQNITPITYQLEKRKPLVKNVTFNPIFKEHLYFVYLNQKQNSREGIAHYKAQNKEHIKEILSEVNSITTKMISCSDLNSFQELINQHETIIAKVTNQTPVQELLFNDFKGSIKSLGAWGGDFVLIASITNPTGYFKNKGFETIISYSDMVL